MPVSKKRAKKKPPKTHAVKRATGNSTRPIPRAPPSREPVTLRANDTNRRAAGWALVGIGALIVIVNWIAELGIDVMPGGHEELYFLGGLVIATAGAWLLGLFSKQT